MPISNPIDIPNCIQWIDPENSEGIIFDGTHTELINSMPSWHTGSQTAGLVQGYGAGGFLRRAGDTILGRQAMYQGPDVAALRSAYGMAGTEAFGSISEGMYALVYQPKGAPGAWYGALIDSTTNGAKEAGAISHGQLLRPTAQAGFPDVIGPGVETLVVDTVYVIFVWTDGTGAYVKAVNVDDSSSAGTNFVANAGTFMNAPLYGAGRSNTTRHVNGLFGSITAYSRILTQQEQDDFVDWVKTGGGTPVQPPHTGSHTVQDTTNANDPNNIYYQQGVNVGDTFSFKETTETNGWAVSIDALGYPIIDPEGGSGTDSFLFNIDRGAGWEPEPPASYTWDFTIGAEGPIPPTYAPKVTYLRRPIAWDASSGWQGVDDGAWSASGLPDGYVINTSSGIVTGTATAAGTTQTIVTVDGVSADPFDWTVEEKPGGGGSGSRGVNILRPKVHTRDIKRRGWRMGRRGRR
jgi:hypothetical protein